MFDLLPNQMQGFARSAGEAFHPAMWLGYVGGMYPCLGFGGRNAPDPSPRRYDGAIVGTAYSMTASPIGPSMRFSGNAAVQWSGDATLGNKFKFAAGNDGALTIHAYFKYIHKTGANNMTLFRSDNPVASNPYGYYLYVDANADSLVFEPHRGETGLETPPIVMPVYTALGALTGGKWHNVAVTWRPWDVADPEFGQYAMMYIDGKAVFPTFTHTERTITHSSSLHSRCGASVGALAPDLEVALVHVWNRRLYGAEVGMLMVDPPALFRRRGGALSKGSRLVSIGGTALRRLNVAVAG